MSQKNNSINSNISNPETDVKGANSPVAIEQEIKERERKADAKRRGGAGNGNKDKPWFIPINMNHIKIIMKGLSQLQKIMLIILMLHADDNKESYPSQNTIAKEAHTTTRSITNNIQILEEKKFIKIIRTDGRVNRYKVIRWS